MSTSVSQPSPASSWKQEVSLRIAAHQNRRGFSGAKPSALARIRQSPGSRAAQAAARVAARYAQAPSYSQMLSAEGRSAPPAAAFAPPAAQRAQADAAGPRPWEPEAAKGVTPARPASLPDSLEAWESQYARTRREPDLRLLPPEPVSVPAGTSAPWLAEGLASPAEDGREKPALGPELVEDPWDVDELAPVEPALPIHGNLIEFPRELVATRKMRPRRAEGPFAVESLEKQLSIFEVDPGAISTGAEAAGAAPVSAWPEPDWSGIELEAQSPDQPEPQEAPAPELAPELAPVGRRLTAVLVDGALIAGIGLGSALAVAANFGYLPATRIVELGAASALLLVGMIYQALFLALAGATPGMRCARISLCTFDGQIPTSSQMRSRLGALLLSVVPVGLGLAWALFDEDHLCWHDRLSRTYLRRG